MDRREFLRRIAVAAASTGAIGMAACGGGSSGGGAGGKNQPVTIRALSFENAVNIKNLLKAYQLYHDAHKNVTISAEVTDYSAYTQKLATLVAGNNTPDELASNTSVIPQYGSKHVLLPLDKLVSSKAIDLTGFVQSAIEGNKYGGVLYGVPFDVVAPTIVYNKTLFQKAGVEMPPQMWTWDEFAKTAVSVSKALGKGYWGTEDFSGSNEDGFSLWLRAKGKDYVLANGKLGFNQADLIAWYKFWDDLRRAGGAPPGTIQAQENPSQTETSLLAQGKAAMFGTLTPQFINIKSHMPDSLDLHMVPNGFSKSGMKNHHFLISGYSASIARSSKHQDVAASIINFILNDPQASKIYFSGSRIPCSAKTRQQLEKSLPSDDPKRLSLGYVDTVAKDASSVPYRAGSASLTDLFSRSAQSVALGQASIDAAAKSFFSQAPQYLTTS